MPLETQSITIGETIVMNNGPLIITPTQTMSQPPTHIPKFKTGETIEAPKDYEDSQLIVISTFRILYENYIEKEKFYYKQMELWK